MFNNDTIPYIKSLMRLRLSRRRSYSKLCDDAIAQLETSDLAAIQGAISEIDRLILSLPLPHALMAIDVLKRRAPSVLAYMRQTVDARHRQASSLLKLLETFKPSHLQMIRAALEIGKVE